MDDVVRNLHVLWRAESSIADIHLRHLLKRSGLRGFAALIGIFGLLMLNVTGFFGFEQLWGPVWAAATVSTLDFGLAFLLLLIAGLIRPGQELELAVEVRQSALDAIAADARSVQREVAALRDDIYKIRSALSGLVNHPLDAMLAGLIVPLASMLLKTVKKPRSA
ncbi:MAG TPA: phage holin family protein [Xanthobacteraceae bacterium]|nr:phage holin family protein [Xanthobacteraceae bacterium]